MAGKSGVLIRIYGVVQGVGFRPFAARLAKKYNISGHVKNRGGFVEVLAAPAAEDGSLRLFLHDLSSSAPPGSAIIHTEEVECEVNCNGFKIAESLPDEDCGVMLPPDLAPCDNCVKELYDKSDRRYRHPFISCTSCGARYSVIDSIPYDRENTTQGVFPLCNNCDREYTTHGDRRLCAQTICCNDCGPELSFGDKKGYDAIVSAADKISKGGVIAVKGIGGYHLACSPFDGDALSRLRRGKKRLEKPFAVMFPDLETLMEYCVVSDVAKDLIESPARPIVLLPHGEKKLHSKVCMESAYVGGFLPSAPHQMLLCDITGPLVMTSGNLSGLPIATSVEELDGLYIDGILDHNRKINTPLDDSVILPMNGGISFIRRSRGYVPLPVHLKSDMPDTLAAGGDLKSAFGLRHGNWCYISQHLGDLEDMANQDIYRNQLEHMSRIFNIRPTICVCDMHPGYFSSEIARSMGLETYAVQHHHAHILSAMAENEFDGECIGIALDGTGYGDDNNIWGFEFLKCTRHDFVRCGHLKYTSMTSSDSAMKDARRSAMCHLLQSDMADKLFDGDELKILRLAHSANINTVLTSGAGRLFDAAAYLLGCGDYNHFEGQCAQSLERLALHGKGEIEFSFPLEDEKGGFILDPLPLFDGIINSSAPRHEKAYAFHSAIAGGICHGACRIRDMYGLPVVALGGGVFQNTLLSRLVSELLTRQGFKVIRNSSFPCGDGGLALGQLHWSPEE